MHVCVCVWLPSLPLSCSRPLPAGPRRVTDGARTNFAGAAPAAAATEAANVYQVYLCPACNLAGILEWRSVSVLFLCVRQPGSAQSAGGGDSEGGPSPQSI